jgi:hypothetical protein
MESVTSDKKTTNHHKQKTFSREEHLQTIIRVRMFNVVRGSFGELHDCCFNAHGVISRFTSGGIYYVYFTSLFETAVVVSIPSSYVYELVQLS